MGVLHLQAFLLCSDVVVPLSSSVDFSVPITGWRSQWEKMAIPAQDYDSDSGESEGSASNLPRKASYSQLVGSNACLEHACSNNYLHQRLFK